MSQINIKCPHCQFEKNVERGKIPDNLKSIKCPQCKEAFSFELPEEEFIIEDIPVDEAPTQTEVIQREAPLNNFKFCSSCGNKIHAKAEICTKCGVWVAPPPGSINKVALLLITFFLGGIGGHKFYTKKYLAGALYLLFFWTNIPWVIAMVEFFMYAFKSEPELQEQFPDTSGGAIVLAVVVPFFFVAIMGILAAIAIPQFAAYRQKAYNSAAHSDLANCKTQVESFYTDHGYYPTDKGQVVCLSSNEVALYYIPSGPESFQLISFHDKGTKAYISDSDSTSIDCDEKESIKSEVQQAFGPTAMEHKFHFMN